MNTLLRIAIIIMAILLLSIIAFEAIEGLYIAYDVGNSIGLELAKLVILVLCLAVTTGLFFYLAHLTTRVESKTLEIVYGIIILLFIVFWTILTVAAISALRHL